LDKAGAWGNGGAHQHIEGAIRFGGILDGNEQQRAIFGFMVVSQSCWGSFLLTLYSAVKWLYLHYTEFFDGAILFGFSVGIAHRIL